MCPSLDAALGAAHDLGKLQGSSQRLNPVPHKCSCCDGWGKRETEGPIAHCPTNPECPACKGKGVLWGLAQEEATK